MNCYKRWGLAEFTFEGRSDGNPFQDYSINAEFSCDSESVRVSGFYDGDGVYKVRFMPRYEGVYKYRVYGGFSEGEAAGEFCVKAASTGNHGPVRVANRFHFAYEDGTPFYPAGTTCYTWALQDSSLRSLAIESFAAGYFNKVRFALWRHGNPLMSYTEKEQPHYPFLFNISFDGKREWDFSSYDVDFFRIFEAQIGTLMDMGIEADIILMMPNERYGFQQMNEKLTSAYLKYTLARFSAYRNVWWTVTNEYDFINSKSLDEWNRYGQLIAREDPYGHLRSIHYWLQEFDYSTPWITHCCVQSQNISCVSGYANYWRERYGKPVMLDEIAYEGNLDIGWGNLTGEEMVYRFWLAAITGGYASHGESYIINTPGYTGPNMRTGAALYGTSPARILFLRQILGETPGCGLKPLSFFDPMLMHDGCFVGAGSSVTGAVSSGADNCGFGWDDPAATAEDISHAGEYYLIYLGKYCPGFKAYCLNETDTYDIDVIDTWNMTIERRGRVNGQFRVDLPERPYMAIRIRKVV